MSNILKGLNETQSHEGAFLLTESRTYKLWESAGQKIAEAQLTADQINQIFQYAEKIQTAGGDNRTMLGKGKDVAGAAASKTMDAASAVNKAWEDLKTKVQDSGPIQNVDAMYDKAAEKLKQATGGDQGVMQYVQKYRDFAKKHPIAQSLIYSALIAAAGISGAGLGGAAALGLFKMVDKLLQGEKFSSATYSGAKTGAMAYGASKVGDMVKGAMQHAKYGAEEILPVVGQQAADAAAGAATSSAADIAANTIQNVAGAGVNAFKDPAVMNSLADAAKTGGKEGFMAAINQIAPAVSQNTKEMMYQAAMRRAGLSESTQLSESQIYLIIGKIVHKHKLQEGVMDTLKGAAGKAVDWAKTKGTNLTTKVTADKLLQAWKKAGSPTDSLDVASIIQNAGVPADTIKQVYSNMKIPAPGQPGGGNDMTRKIDVDPSSVAPAASGTTPSQPTTASPTATPSQPATAASPAKQQAISAYQQVKKLVDQLDKRNKQRVVAALRKDLQLAEGELELGELMLEAVDQSWIEAYKALEANGGEPNVDKPTLFVKQLAMLAKDAGIQPYYVDDFVQQYVSDRLKAFKTSGLVKQALKQAPSMTDMKKYTQQSHADDVSFAQQQEIGQLQHELSAQQLINQSNLEKADAEQLVQMDANARFAIQAMKQELALDAKERLHKLQMEIDATAERKDIRDHELKLAQAGYDHEVNVINVRAEGEYKKAKLEADYQIHIKQLENIDNASERQNKLDQINADKARQIEVIDAETNAKVRVLQKEVDVERQQNDLAIEKAYMMTFNPIWGSAVSAAQLAGKTWKGAINNINKALSMLASPIMPKPVKETGLSQTRKTDAKGRTQQQWIEAVYKKFPDARIVQAKMIDGPAHAMLPDGRRFSWKPVEQEVVNEVDPHRFDSDIDYYNALNKKPRGRSEDDYVEPYDDEPIKFQKKPESRPEYSIDKNENREAGYNMTVTVKAPTTQQAKWELDGYIDHNWGAKKQVGKINTIADGVVQVHMIDNHKYGMWKPWKDEPPIGEPISFGEGSKKEADYGDEYQSMVKRVGQMAKQGERKTVWDPVKRVYKTVPVKAQGSLNEFAPDNNGDSGEEDTLLKYAKMWYKGDDATRLKVERILDRMGWEIGPLESEEGGVFVVQPDDEDGDTYIGFTPDELAEDMSEDWQKVNKRDKTDGMSRKAVKAYRRENPGSKLKTAVTTKPSKLKKGSKAAKRRKSFCARMSGMKKAHASAKTKRDPNSPINKALRRWNCESVEQLQELMMIAEAKIAEAKNAKQQAAIAISKKKAQGVDEEKQRLDPKCWTGYKKQGTKMKGGVRVNNCVPVKETKSNILKGLM